MSTKVTIKARQPSAGEPGFYLYDDVLDEFRLDEADEAPVYLTLEGVAVQMTTLAQGGASVTIELPRELARVLGLLPAQADQRK